MTDRIDSFNEKAKEIFKILTVEYGYVLDEVKITSLHSVKWSTQLIYINSKHRLKLIIKQEPYYTDYGFSVFIYKDGTDEYNILYYLPHEKQDKEDRFLSEVYEDLFSTTETFDIITGKRWVVLNNIPFKP